MECKRCGGSMMKETVINFGAAFLASGRHGRRVRIVGIAKPACCWKPYPRVQLQRTRVAGRPRREIKGCYQRGGV